MRSRTLQHGIKFYRLFWCNNNYVGLWVYLDNFLVYKSTFFQYILSCQVSNVSTLRGGDIQLLALYMEEQ